MSPVQYGCSAEVRMSCQSKQSFQLYYTVVSVVNRVLIWYEALVQYILGLYYTYYTIDMSHEVKKNHLMPFCGKHNRCKCHHLVNRVNRARTQRSTFCAVLYCSTCHTKLRKGTSALLWRIQPLRIASTCAAAAQKRGRRSRGSNLFPGMRRTKTE